ncbi:MAG: efflux RND transporter permease subunit [Polyangiaceae bacterium]|nr:efflux RND transporter permease subunit [Polyangiaceae bacterium]
MLDKVIKASLDNRLVVVLLTLLTVVWGVFETERMALDVFPDLTAPTVTVISEAHGMAPEEVETQITVPIEAALSGAPGVRRIRSSTAVGLSIVWVEFDWGRDIYQARQMVTERIASTRGRLPHGVDEPVLGPVASIMGEVMFVALQSESGLATDLRTWADWTVRRRLLSVPGVSQVVMTGGSEKQYQIIVKPERLAAYELGLDRVVEALENTNENVPAGFYVTGGQEYLIQGIGRVRSLEDLENTVIEVRDGQPLLVRHVADVRIGAAIPRGAGSYGGKPALILGVQKQPGVNSLELTASLDRALDDIQRELPEGMILRRDVFRQADFIETAVGNVVGALRDGAFLVLFIVLIFLMSGRATLITMLAIPLSLLASIIAMSALGVTLNTMSLGGMAIAVGALVDDAIVDVENVVRRLRENMALPGDQQRSQLDVVFQASREIRGAIVFATLIIVLVFVPVGFLAGVEGRLLRPLGFAYVVSVLASLAVALTVTPVLCSLLLPSSSAVQSHEEKGLPAWLKRVYEPLLRSTLDRWGDVAAVAVLAFVVAAACTFSLGRSFLPTFNEGALTIGAVTLPGTSLEQSDAIGRTVETLLMEVPEVKSVARRTGRPDSGEHTQDSNVTEVDVALAMGSRSIETVTAEIRKKLSAVPGTNILIGQPISHRIDHMLSGTRANIAVKVFGDDLRVLRQTAEAVKAVMDTIPGVVDLSIEQQSDIPLLTVKADRAAIARHGLSVHDVTEATEIAFLGHTASRVLEGQRSFDLIIRYPPEVLEDIEAIESALVMTPGGAPVHLHALADIRKERGPSAISHENGQRKIVVQCNVAGRDLGSVIGDIRSRIASEVKFPDGYRVAYGGQFASAESASRTLMAVGVGVLIAIFVLLLGAFGSVRDALLVLLNLPLALIGGVAGVYASGGVLSIASIVGFIALFGIATRNGLLMVSHVHHLVREEQVLDAREAVVRGAVERLNPILMTALASGLALVPLVMRAGEPGTEIQSPMAVVILFGLITSTALNMVVLPALYLRFGAIPRQLAATAAVGDSAAVTD